MITPNENAGGELWLAPRKPQSVRLTIELIFTGSESEAEQIELALSDCSRSSIKDLRFAIAGPGRTACYRIRARRVKVRGCLKKLGFETL